MPTCMMHIRVERRLRAFGPVGQHFEHKRAERIVNIIALCEKWIDDRFCRSWQRFVLVKQLNMLANRRAMLHEEANCSLIEFFC